MGTPLPEAVVSRLAAVADDPAATHLLDWSHGVMGDDFTPRQIRAAAP